MAYNIGKILGKSGTTAALSLLEGLFLGEISSGQYTFSYGGENVTIALENGGVKTAFGDYKYTYQQLMELIK